MITLRHEEVTERFVTNNACGAPRTVVIRRNEHDRYTWRVVYQDNPAISDVEHTYTWHWYDSAKAARRAARRFVRTLGQ
jgi:hypothetical protein